MKKIYWYFCLFFLGSLLPFIIVEYYFQDYYTISFLAILAGIVFTLCVSIEYARMNLTLKNNMPQEKIDIDYINLLQKKDLKKRAAYFSFWKNIWL